MVFHPIDLHKEGLGNSYLAKTEKYKFCIMTVNVNIESARRKCKGNYVVCSQTYDGMSWHFRSVAVNGRLSKVLTST